MDKGVHEVRLAVMEGPLSRDNHRRSPSLGEPHLYSTAQRFCFLVERKMSGCYSYRKKQINAPIYIQMLRAWRCSPCFFVQGVNHKSSDF